MRFELSNSTEEVRITLGYDFATDLPGTKEFQLGLELYLTALARSFREHGISEYATISGIPVKFQIEFPFNTSTEGGSFAFVHVLTKCGSDPALEANFSVHLPYTIARQIVSLESVITEPLVVNAVRKVIDMKQAIFYAEGKHPLELQVVTIQPADYDYKAKRFTYVKATDKQVREFLKRKVYSLGFRRGNQSTRVCIADPYDAAYLNVSAERLQQAAAILAAEGVIQIDSSGLYANAGTKLLQEARGLDHELAAFLGAEPSREEEVVLLPSRTITPVESPLFDVFISHATEDKPYVEPLVKALEAAGIRVWFDKSTLEWGDDLRSSIDRGLSNCRYGIVIFSRAFLGKKKWTEYELNSLFALEQPDKKIILPIWHGITRDDLLQYSAGFADRLAKVSSRDTYEDIVESLLGMLGRSKPQESEAAHRKRESQRQDTALNEHEGGHNPVLSPQTEAARRLSDATRDLQKAAWSYVELHSRYGVARAVRDVAAEEKEILRKVERAIRTFERDYDLPSDLAHVAKNELANINISFDMLTSRHDLATMRIAAEQIQDSCGRVRESAKQYAYLKNDAVAARQTEKLEHPTATPVIVPKRYGKGVLKDHMGYTGVAVVNDGEQPAYDITIHNIQINDGGKLAFYSGHTERLTKSDGEVFYPAFVQMRLGGIFGSGLFDFMRERGIVSITVPITYRDASDNWFQTDVTIERDVEKSGGLRLGWKQKRIPNPDSENA